MKCATQSVLIFLLLVVGGSSITAFVVGPAIHCPPEHKNAWRRPPAEVLGPTTRTAFRLHAKKAKNIQSDTAASSSSSSSRKIVTGPQGRPAASKEEDLRLTLQIIREFHGLQETFAADDATAVEEPIIVETAVQKEKAEEEDVSAAVVNFDDIIERLSRPCYAAPLARIASAFAPAAGQALPHPNKIDSVSVIRLEAARMELAALVCEGGDCVNIAIPVTFPTSCAAAVQPPSQQALEDCILDNIDQLDATATAGIAQREQAEDNYEQLQSEERLRTELQDDSIRPVLPDWWTEPLGEWQLQDECASVKQLLNDDEFQADIYNLAQQQVAALTSIPSGMKVTQAAVALVGTSGALLRAHLRGEEKDDDGATPTRIVDLPVPFPSGQAMTVQALRLAVLSLVDDAS